MVKRQDRGVYNIFGAVRQYEGSMVAQHIDVNTMNVPSVLSSTNRSSKKHLSFGCGLGWYDDTQG